MAVAITHKDNKISDTPVSTWTANCNLGTTGHNVINVGWRAATEVTISSVTVDGQAATSIVPRTDGDAAGTCTAAQMFIAPATGNATGDVVVTFSGSVARMGMGVHQITGINSTTPHDTATSIADPSEAAIDCPADGGIIAYALSGANGTTSTPTELTENFDEQTAALESTHTGLSKIYAAQQTGLTVGCNFATTTNQTMVAASFTPLQVNPPLDNSGTSMMCLP